jgi:aspartate racemase
MTLGVIGGLGPIATAYFMELIIQMTDAAKDQEHLAMIIYHSPEIADRTSYILGNSPKNPVWDMIQIGRKLADQEVACISIPCITAHYFHKELSENVPVPIIHAIQETGIELRENHIKSAGIMATDGTIHSGIFQSRLEEIGIKTFVPTKDDQKMVMELIYQEVKAGKPVDLDKFQRVSQHLREQGAQVIILGCTELSLIKRDFPIGSGYLDTMELLAQRSILRCQGRLKKEYEHLIT